MYTYALASYFSISLPLLCSISSPIAHICFLQVLLNKKGRLYSLFLWFRNSFFYQKKRDCLSEIVPFYSSHIGTGTYSTNYNYILPSKRWWGRIKDDGLQKVCEEVHSNSSYSFYLYPGQVCPNWHTKFS